MAPTALDSTTFANLAPNQTVGPVNYFRNSGDTTGNLLASLSSLLAGAGGGSANLFLNAQQSTQITGAGKTVTDGSSAGAYITVEYDYTVNNGTPEPATMLLFGSGLIALGVIRKRVRN